MTATAAAAAMLATELRVQARYGIQGLLLGLAVPWAALAWAVPAAAPYLIFLEVAAAGTFLAGALCVTDRATGIDAALAASPALPAVRVGVRVAPLLVWILLATVPVLAAAGTRGYAAPLAAVGLTALLLLATGVAVAARRRSLIGYLTTVPWLLAPLLAVPLAVAAGLLTGPAWYAVPTTGALEVLRGVAGYPAWALLAWLAAGAAAATGWAASAQARATGRSGGGERGTRGSRPSPPPTSFVRADLRHVARDAIVLPVAASPVLLGLALRFGVPPLTDWALRVPGVDLTPYLPVLALLAVVLHVPVIAGMLGALMVLDDHDDGALRALALSPMGLPAYLRYRLGLVTGLATLGMAVAVPLSGAVPPSAWAACLLAVPAAPLFTLAVLASASNRVTGVAVIKLLGAAVYAPIAAWWLTGPAGWGFAWLPTFWVVRAWSPPDPWLLVGGVLCAAGWGAVLWSRAHRRLSDSGGAG